MAHSREWNESKPTGGEKIRLGDDEIRDTKRDIRERMQVDHKWNESINTDGFHKKVMFDETQIVDPTTTGRAGCLYIKEVSGVKELFFKDAAGNIKQLTSGGKLNISSDEAVLLSGDQTINGVKTFTSIPILPSSDPTQDNEATRKAYVDINTKPEKTNLAGNDLFLIEDSESSNTKKKVKYSNIGSPFSLGTYNKGTVYQNTRPRKILVVAYSTGYDDQEIYGEIGATSPPTLVVVRTKDHVDASYQTWVGITFVVPPGYYWRVNANGSLQRCEAWEL